MSQNLLIELFSEEIPARMQKGAMENLEALFHQKITKLGLSYEGLECHSTPRRLVLYATDLPIAQADFQEERRGPRHDAQRSIVENFLKATGLTQDQCEIRETPKGIFYFAVISKKGQKLRDLLPLLISEIIYEFPWPKSMRWAGSSRTWVRPLISGLCLLGDQSLSFDIKMGEGPHSPVISFSNSSFGHRFLAPNAFAVENYAHYCQELANRYVILDRKTRGDMIVKQAQKLAAEVGYRLRSDLGLLEEVVGLIDYPFVYLGKINPDFMVLPTEVLITSMRVHQRYFCLEDTQGNLAPYFIIVANTKPRDAGEKLIKGNERVLKARLSDAQFFYQQDQKIPLLQQAQKLERLIFQDQLGTLGDKSLRLQKLAIELAPVFHLDSEMAAQAAFLAKADLVTEMVGEFPELQGIMGKYYAQTEGMSPEIAQAIAEHYLPKGSKDQLPVSLLGGLIALIDRLDTLVGFFALGIRPTGSKDPHALRRIALAILRLLEQQKNDFPLESVLKKIYQMFYTSFPTTSFQSQHVTLEAIQDFMKERLKVYWRDENLSQDILAAAFESGHQDSIYGLKQRCLALQNFLKREERRGALLLNAYRRASNIVRVQEKNSSVQVEIDPSLFKFPIEQRLFDQMTKVRNNVQKACQSMNFNEALQELETLKIPIDEYFDGVTINVEDQKDRLNRLATLIYFRSTFEYVADFSKIVETGEEKTHNNN